MSAPLSIEIIKNVLLERGYECDSIRLADKKGFMRVKKDGRTLLTIARGYPLYPFATSSAYLIAANKHFSYEFVRPKGVAVPHTVVIEGDGQEGWTQASDLLERSGSVVVKPLDAAGSEGLTRDVTTPEALTAAVAKARRDSSAALVQRQFFGEEFRFVVVDGKVVAALMRQKPRVVGDGKATLSELIKRENDARKRITDTLVSYPQLDGLVDPALLESKEIVAEGETYELSKSTMIKGGASVLNFTGQVHADYVAIAERAAEDFGRGFIVVDMMIQDWQAPATNDNYVFIEFNLAPALALFYSCRDGNHVRVAEEYLVPMLIEATRGRA